MDIEKICKEISKEQNIDQELVRKIVYFQFQFVREVMQDPEDIHDILLNKLFKFKLKRRFKENKQQKLTSK